jgi:hypothetical protein
MDPQTIDGVAMLRDHNDAVCPAGSVSVVPTPAAIFSWSDEPQPRPATSGPKQRPVNDPAAGDQRDLCCICSYVSDCMYRGAPEQPKLHCELFDVDVSALGMRENRTGQSELREEGAPDLKGGLCCNCENRQCCTIRTREGDVWHCEEYC